VAKAAGKLRGRKPKLSPRQEAHLLELHQGGTKTPADLAELFCARPLDRLPRARARDREADTGPASAHTFATRACVRAVAVPPPSRRASPRQDDGGAAGTSVAMRRWEVDGRTCRTGCR